MADLINVYNPAFWAQESLLQLFPNLRMAGLVYREFEAQVAQQGDTVNTRLPNTFTASDVNPDAFASTKPTATNVQVKLDKWKQVVFEIGDKEASLCMKDLIAEFVTPAAFALAEAVEDALMALYKDSHYYTGVAGTTPASVSALGTDVKEKFDLIKIPDLGRNVVLNPAAVNKFNQVFYQDYVSGSPDQQVTGALRPKFGMRYIDSNKLPNHTAGTNDKTGAIDNGAGYPAGTTTIHVDAFGQNKTFVVGDIIVVGGYSHVVTANATTTNDAEGECDLVISPGLYAAVVDDQVVTCLADHAVNLAFHSQAFALVSRPLKVPTAPGAAVSTMNFQGVGLRSSVWYEPKDVRTYVRLDLLFGVKTLDSRKAIRVLG